MTSPACTIPSAGCAAADHRHDHRFHRGDAELTHGRGDGVGLRGREQLVVALGDLVAGVVRVVVDLPRDDAGVPGEPAQHRLPQVHPARRAAALADRGHVQRALGRIGGRPGDGDHGRAVDLTERVERRAGAGHEQRQTHDGAGDQQRHAGDRGSPQGAPPGPRTGALVHRPVPVPPPREPLTARLRFGRLRWWEVGRRWGVGGQVLAHPARSGRGRSSAAENRARSARSCGLPGWGRGRTAAAVVAARRVHIQAANVAAAGMLHQITAHLLAPDEGTGRPGERAADWVSTGPRGRQAPDQGVRQSLRQAIVL